MSEGRSWFYLTLWSGTPPEFTDEFDADITKTEFTATAIHEQDDASADIDTEFVGAVDIVEKDTATVSIIQTLEVIWLVG